MLESGFLNVLKPPGMSSFDVVFFVRKLLPRGTKVGHMGTLDPSAAGVLPIGVGSATRLFDDVSDKEKTYIAELRLGIETDTQDADGQICGTAPLPPMQAIADALPAFVGQIEQTPSVYSAIHVDGRRGYELAREGKAVAMPKRSVFIKDIAFLGSSAPDRAMIQVDCGRGTYIRSLVVDIAKAVGSCAHLSMLLRSRSGIFCLDTALTLEEIRRASEETGTLPLLPLDYPLGHMKRVDLPPSEQKKVLNGAKIPGLHGLEPGERSRLYVGGRFAGIVKAEENQLRFAAMLLKES